MRSEKSESDMVLQVRHAAGNAHFGKNSQLRSGNLEQKKVLGVLTQVHRCVSRALRGRRRGQRTPITAIPRRKQFLPSHSLGPAGQNLIRHVTRAFTPHRVASRQTTKDADRGTHHRRQGTHAQEIYRLMSSQDSSRTLYALRLRDGIRRSMPSRVSMDLASPTSSTPYVSCLGSRI